MHASPGLISADVGDALRSRSVVLICLTHVEISPKINKQTNPVCHVRADRNSRESEQKAQSLPVPPSHLVPSSRWNIELLMGLQTATALKQQTRLYGDAGGLNLPGSDSSDIGTHQSSDKRFLTRGFSSSLPSHARRLAFFSAGSWSRQPVIPPSSALVFVARELMFYCCLFQSVCFL